MHAPLSGRGAMLGDFGIGMAAALGGGPFRGRGPTPTLPMVLNRIFSSGGGAEYSTSDLASLYQDTTGLTPGSVASAVGLMFDERLTLTSRLNLFTHSDQLDNTVAWPHSFVTVVADSAVAPDGTMTADTITSTAGGGTLNAAAMSIMSGGLTLVASISLLKTVGATAYPMFSLFTGGGTGVEADVFLNTNTGVAVARAGFTGPAAISVVDQGTFWRLTFSLVTNPANGSAFFQIYPASSSNGTSYDGSLTGSCVAWGADLRYSGSSGYQRIAAGTGGEWAPGNHASQSTSIQRPVVTAYGPYPGLLFDGADDNLTAATGGGGNAGFFWCGAVKVVSGDGTARSIFSDVGTNTGYRVRIASTNKLALGAGNGAAYTSATTTDSVLAGNSYVLTVWDDGANLNAQVNRGDIAQAVRPAVSAGPGTFSLGRDNSGLTALCNMALFEMVYRKNGGISDRDRRMVQRYCANKAGISI